MDRYFGREKFKELVQEISKGGQGNTPDEERNARIRAEWKEALHKNKSRFAREYCERHPEEGRGRKAHTKVRGQLNRLLDIEERQVKKKAEFQEAMRYRSKSLLGDTK